MTEEDTREHDLNKYGFYRSPSSTTKEMRTIRAIAKKELAGAPKKLEGKNDMPKGSINELQNIRNFVDGLQSYQPRN